MAMISPVALEVAVVCLGIFMLMLDAFVTALDRRHIASAGIAGLTAILVASFFTTHASMGMDVSGYYLADPLAMFFKRFALVSAILTLVLGLEYAPILERYVPAAVPQAGLGEFFTLPVFACAGLMWMASAADFIIIFCSLELVTITFYILVSYARRNMGSLEAGVKYLILGSLSTGFIVYGITWIFGATGQTGLGRIAAALVTMPASHQNALLFGVGLVLVALGFKIAAAPFQFWVPDVYQGAPTPVTAFLSVGSKAAGFVVLLRVLAVFMGYPAIHDRLVAVVSVIAGITVIYGNLAALPQTNVKRLLAYSSVAHAGYLLIAVASPLSHFAAPAIVFYLAGYLLMTYLAFLVLLIVEKAVGGDDIAHFNGLSKRAPGLALAMLLAMVSLAGLPFTVGFFGKFFIFEAAMDSKQVVLVVLGVAAVASGFYYYLKVIRAMYWQPALDAKGDFSMSGAAKLTLAVLSGLIILLGFYPQPVFWFLPDNSMQANLTINASSR